MKKLDRIFRTHMLSENIFSFWAEKLAVLAKNYRHGCQNCNLCTFRKFWGKTVFLKMNMIANFFGLRDEKKAFSQKIFFRFFTTGIRASREMAWGKMNCLSKKFYFSVIIFGVWVIYLSLLQNFLVRCVKPPFNVRREINGEINLEKLFFQSILNFEEKKLVFSAKQWGMILKTVAYLCSWPFSEVFLEAKIFVWKFSVNERKHRISGGNVSTGVSNVHFKCSVQHFEKKMIKVNFTFCGLFRTVCVFFWSERKVSQEFQNHKLSVQMKKLGRIILTQMLSENTFGFWAEKLGVLAKNYRHCCQNCNLRTFKKFWGKTVFFKIEHDCKLLRSSRWKK